MCNDQVSHTEVTSIKAICIVQYAKKTKIASNLHAIARLYRSLKARERTTDGDTICFNKRRVRRPFDGSNLLLPRTAVVSIHCSYRWPAMPPCLHTEKLPLLRKRVGYIRTRVLGSESQALLDFSNGLCWVQSLRACPRAIENGVASVQTHAVFESFFAFGCSLIS